MWPAPKPISGGCRSGPTGRFCRSIPWHNEVVPPVSGNYRVTAFIPLNLKENLYENVRG
jgi:hypothetical protein